MNVPTLIAGAIVIALIGSVVLYQIRSRKKGKACSCGCSGCGMRGTCHAKNK